MSKIYYTTLINEFGNDRRFLHPIDHSHNTRIRSQGRNKIQRFTNDYSRNTMQVVLPTTLNKIPTNILNITHKPKKQKEIKKYL